MNPKLELAFIIKCDVLWVMQYFPGITRGFLFAAYSSDEKQFRNNLKIDLKKEKIA